MVFVPGVTGVVLQNSKTHEIAWGTGRNLLRPKDDAYSLALPTVHADPGLPVLEPVAPIEQLTLFGIHKPIYGPIRELLTGAGYVLGNLSLPRVGESVFFFNYDWRRDLTESAGILRRQLEELRRVQGKERLEVDLICQSSGAHLCRYLAKYGGVPLAEAEAGRLPPTLSVRRLILVGSSNGGSLRILREIHRGRRYLPLIGRWMRPEVTFTFPSLFQDLPIYRRDLFLDAQGHPLDVDLFDPASWHRYGWSVFGKDTARRLREKGFPRFLGEEADRDAWLRRALSEGRRFQELLHADAPGFGETRVYVVGSADQPTPDRAVLIRKGNDWRMLFTGDPALSRNPALYALATAEGDEHATLASQDLLSPQEKAALVLPPRRIRGGHFEALLTPEVGTFLLEALGRIGWTAGETGRPVRLLEAESLPGGNHGIRKKELSRRQECRQGAQLHEDAGQLQGRRDRPSRPGDPSQGRSHHRADPASGRRLWPAQATGTRAAAAAAVLPQEPEPLVPGPRRVAGP